MNYYEFLERPSARLIHRLPYPLVTHALTQFGRLGLLSDADFLTDLIEQTAVADESRARQISSAVLGNLGSYFSDIGILMHGTDRQIRNAFMGRVRVENLGHWEALQGGQFMIIGAHFACFYLAAFAEGLFEKVTIIRRFHSRGRDALIDRLCKLTGKDIEVIGLTDPGVGMKVVKRLKARRPVSGMMDFSYADTTTFITPFMGRDSSTPAGLPMIAAKMDVPLLPVIVLRDKDKSYVVKLGEPLRPKKGLDEIESAFDLTCRINAHIENAIRSAPTQWTFWPSLPARWAFAEGISALEKDEVRNE